MKIITMDMAMLSGECVVSPTVGCPYVCLNHADRIQYLRLGPYRALSILDSNGDSPKGLRPTQWDLLL